MKIFKNIISYFICLFLVLSGSFVSAEQFYKSYPVVDYKTDIELMRTIIPDEFEAQNKVTWSRNIETPLFVNITAENPQKTVLFYYVSPKTYLVLPNVDSKLLSSDIDVITNINIKNFESSEELAQRLILSMSPNAKDIKPVSEKVFPDELRNYLLEEFLNKTQNYYKNNMKMNSNIISLSYSKHFLVPFYSTYSFNENGKEYLQSFITTTAGFDYDITLAKFKGQRTKKTGKIIENYGIFSYKAPKDEFEKYKNDFLIFTANTMFNRKTLDTLEEVKIQSRIELNPNLTVKSKIRNTPSTLFSKYYSEGHPDYAEYASMQIPQLGDTRWIIALDNKFEKFDYRTLFDIWRQKVYTTSTTALYNRRTKQFSFDSSTEQKFPWVKLKKAVDIEQNRRYDSGF